MVKLQCLIAFCMFTRLGRQYDDPPKLFFFLDLLNEQPYQLPSGNLT